MSMPHVLSLCVYVCVYRYTYTYAQYVIAVFHVCVEPFVDEAPRTTDQALVKYYLIILLFGWFVMCVFLFCIMLLDSFRLSI